MSRLGELENQCGELCDLKKPVLVENGEFMGTVKAKVVITWEHLWMSFVWKLSSFKFKFE